MTALDLAREPSTDSPVFSLVDGLPTPEIDRAKTDVFRDQAAYSAGAKGAWPTRAARARRRFGRWRASSEHSRTWRPGWSSTS